MKVTQTESGKAWEYGLARQCADMTEFAGKHNSRSLDTIRQMENIAKGMVGKSMTYRELIS